MWCPDERSVPGSVGLARVPMRMDQRSPKSDNIPKWSRERSWGGGAESRQPLGEECKKDDVKRERGSAALLLRRETSHRAGTESDLWI